MQVEVENYAVAYTDRGEGAPILFIHGYPLSRKMWQPQVDGLANNLRVLAPDLPGFGESQAAPGVAYMSRLAGFSAAFLDSLEVNRPVIVCGLSMGGYVALAFYREFAPRMAGLVLAATRATADSEDARKKRDQAIVKAREEGVKAVVEDMLPKMMSPATYDEQPELVDFVHQMMLESSPEGVVSALEGMKVRSDSSILLGEIEMPVLVLYGEDDQIVSKNEAQALAAGIQHGKLVTIPKAGHLLNLEQPQKFNQAILDYLQDIEDLQSP